MVRTRDAGDRRFAGRAEHHPEGGQRDRRRGEAGAGGVAVALPQGHVDGPVVPTRARVLVRAVDGVDDPHPVGVEAGEVVGGLLGEHRVLGALLGEAAQQQLVGAPVAEVPELPASRAGAAQLQQEHAGLGGERLGERLVVGVARHVRQDRAR